MGILNGNYREYKLNNGLVVALQETSTETIITGLNLNYGTVHEKKGEEGLAHLVEHVLFNSETKNYSSTNLKRLKNNLGESNAFTLLDRTYFQTIMLPENLQDSFRFLSSIIFNSKINPFIINQEKKRVLREISNLKGDPFYEDRKKLNKEIFGEKHPFTLDILGKEPVISSSKQKDLKEFYSRGYGAKNMQLFLVGKLPKNIDSLVKKYFGDKPSGQDMKFKFPYVGSLQKKVLMHSYAADLLNKENPQQSNSYVYLGILVPPKNHEDSMALNLLSNILGDGADSKLFRELSEKNGFGYDISSKYDGENNNGMIIIQGNLQSETQNKAIDLIFNEFKKLQKNKIKDNELQIKKKKIVYALTKYFEKNEGHLDAIFTKLECGITPEFIISETAKLTPQKIQEIAIKYLPRSREDNGYALLIRDPLKK